MKCANTFWKFASTTGVWQQRAGYKQTKWGGETSYRAHDHVWQPLSDSMFFGTWHNYGISYKQ